MREFEEYERGNLRCAVAGGREPGNFCCLFSSYIAREMYQCVPA